MLTIPLDNEQPSFFLVHLKWRERTRVREEAARERRMRDCSSRAFFRVTFNRLTKKGLLVVYYSLVWELNS